MKHAIPALTFTLAAGVLALGASHAAMAQQALTEPQVRAQLTAEGYTDIHGLKFKDGMWKAGADSANGKSVEVRIDASTGKIYPDTQVSTLSRHDVEAALETQGYTHVHGVDYDDGIWKAKAENAAGHKVKLRIDPHTGKVVGIH